MFRPARTSPPIPLLLLALCVTLAPAAAWAALAEEAGHDCRGDDCPVCARIEAALGVLRTAGLAALCAGAAWTLARAGADPGGGRGAAAPAVTLVSLRTKSSR